MKSDSVSTDFVLISYYIDNLGSFLVFSHMNFRIKKCSQNNVVVFWVGLHCIYMSILEELTYWQYWGFLSWTWNISSFIYFFFYFFYQNFVAFFILILYILCEIFTWISHFGEMLMQMVIVFNFKFHLFIASITKSNWFLYNFESCNIAIIAYRFLEFLSIFQDFLHVISEQKQFYFFPLNLYASYFLFFSYCSS